MQIIEHPTEFHVIIGYGRFQTYHTNQIKKLDGSRFDWTRKLWIVPIRYKDELLIIKDKCRATWEIYEKPMPQVIGEIKPLPNLDFEIDVKHKVFGYEPR